MYPEGKSVANHLLLSLSRPCLFHPLFPRKEALYAIFSISPQPLLTLMDQCQRLLTRVSCHNLYHEPKSQGLFSFYHLAYSQGKYSRQGKGNSMSRCGSPPPASIQDQCKNKNTSGQNSETSLFMKNYDYPHHAPVSVQLAVSAIHNSVRGKNRLHPVMPPTDFVMIHINSAKNGLSFSIAL